VTVYLFDTRWPDLVIGFIVSIIVLRGAVLILKDAKQELRNNTASNGEVL
jgi:Co/Zn/Cd efflux system component